MDSDRDFAGDRIRPAQRSAGAAGEAGTGILRAEPHGRSDVAGDKRFERGAHGPGAGDHVQRDDVCDHGAGHFLHGEAFAGADPLGADSGAVRGDFRALLRADHSPALGADSGVAGRAFHAGTGKPYRHPGDPRLRAGKAADRGVRRSEPGLRESEHQADRLVESVLSGAFGA